MYTCLPLIEAEALLDLGYNGYLDFLLSLSLIDYFMIGVMQDRQEDMVEFYYDKSGGS